jgi:hypothetical protein
MTETPAGKRAQYWCFDGSSWRLIDDPMPDPLGEKTLYEWYFTEGFQLLLGEPERHGPHISLWTRDRKPECVISHAESGGYATVYADRVPDGIEPVHTVGTGYLRSRWRARAEHVGEGEKGGTGQGAAARMPGQPSVAPAGGCFRHCSDPDPLDPRDFPGVPDCLSRLVNGGGSVPHVRFANRQIGSRPD